MKMKRLTILICLYNDEDDEKNDAPKTNIRQTRPDEIIMAFSGDVNKRWVRSWNNQQTSNLLKKLLNNIFSAVILECMVLAETERPNDLEKICRNDQQHCSNGTCVERSDGKCDTGPGLEEVVDGSLSTPTPTEQPVESPTERICSNGTCVERCDGKCNAGSGKEGVADGSSSTPTPTAQPVESPTERICSNGTCVERCDGKCNAESGKEGVADGTSSTPTPTEQPVETPTEGNNQHHCSNDSCVERSYDKYNAGPDQEGVARLSITSTPTEQPETPTEGLCVIPPHPENGVYNFTGNSTEYSIQLTTLCDTGYLPEYDGFVYCSYGRWSRKIPRCIRSCSFENRHPTISYTCQVGENFNSCRDVEPNGTIVHVRCSQSQEGLPPMTCVNGTWDSFPACSSSADCGRVSKHAKQEQHGLFPWYAQVYQYFGNSYIRICGGSLISPTVVISAAKCFWNEHSQMLLPVSKLAVAVGKQHTQWGDVRDQNVQKSNVSDVSIHGGYQASATNFTNDLAIITLTTAFMYNTNVGPVCLDPYVNFEERHFRKGMSGKGGIFVDDNSNFNGLQVMDLPYLKRDECIQASSAPYASYITADKFCVYNQNIPAECSGRIGTGDRGSGIVFPESDRGTVRYYLRGIVSVLDEDPTCNSYPYIVSTRVTDHYDFITSKM